MSEVIRFATNTPVECALKYDPPGRDVDGKFGPQVLFTTSDDRLIYLHPTVAQKFTDLHITRGEVFTITKAETKNGRKKGIEWQIKRVDSAGGPSIPPDTPRPTAPLSNGFNGTPTGKMGR